MNTLTRRRIGAAVWAGGLLTALVWGALDVRKAEGIGYGFAPPVEVAALDTGRVAALDVALHDLVAADQVLARLDPAPLVAERTVANAQLLAVQEELRHAAATESRRFVETVEDAEVERTLIAAELTETRAALAAERERAEIEQSLLARGATSGQAVEEWRRNIQVLEARIAAGERALEAASSAASGAQARQVAAPVDSPWALVAATREVEAIEGRIARLDLVAGIDGQITWLYRRPGEVVPAGEPVLQVKPRSTHEVVAFLTPSEAARLVAGERASVRRSTGQVLAGELVSVGVGPQEVPPALWAVPSWPQFGVPIRVRLEGEIGPDEPVTVRL